MALQRRQSGPEPVEAPQRPRLADQPSRFILLEREVEREYRPRLLEALQRKVDMVAEEARATVPECPRCGQSMSYHDSRPVSWLAHWGRLQACPARYRCWRCKLEQRPLVDLLGVEPGRVCGSLARLLGLLAAVAPYELAARLARLLLGVDISAMGVWRVAQRLGQAAASYSEALSRYHADSRSEGAALPSERVETSPGRRSVIRRFLVTCLGDADQIFRRLYSQLRELGWVGPHTVVVIVGDGAEWIWNRATMFVHRCEILDFWHALEHAWTFARLRYGQDSAQADRWVHGIAEDLRAGKVDEVIARLKRLRPRTPELRESLQSLIRYYSENAGRMRYDEYLRLGYGIGSGAVESPHKQVVHARLRQAGMRWSEAGARRLLALRLLLLNDQWMLLDRLRMVSFA